MRSITIILALLLSGCASSEWLIAGERKGYRPEDVCIRCGEKPVTIMNERFEAQKRWARGERW
jgi:hypothetical protein